MKMIGMRTAQADQPGGACCLRCLQMVSELEPLVAGDQRIDEVQPQDRDFNPGVCQPR
jgi:hypothetical protein